MAGVQTLNVREHMEIGSNVIEYPLNDLCHKLRLTLRHLNSCVHVLYLNSGYMVL